ncbi:DNA internalization-related competence protein ComEC/Rec2 [Brotaphodocola sp.]|uniref:DNA internalization-related competence protein ComEC/Rec2 n=1 Tax=Brotaphodocola sp. TaxID=3073577 RepID=UPI003D7C9824
MFLAGGFVLGEAWILCGRAVMELLAGMIAAGAVLAAVTAAGLYLEKIQKSKILKPRKKKLSLPVLLLSAAICVGLGMGRAAVERQVCERELALGLDGERVTVTGRVRSITQKDEAWELILDGCSAQSQSQNQGSGGGKLRRILVKADRNTDQKPGQTMDRISCGNRIRVRGSCYAFDEPRAPGEFDYRTYYRSRKLTYRMFATSIGIENRETDVISESLRKVSLHASENLRRAVGEQDAGILRAVLLGDRTELPGEVRTLYQENGIAHILALSGLHLSLVSLAVYGLLRRMGAGFGFSAIAAGVVLSGYAWMSGSSASVIRALVMTLCGFAASYLGRTYDRLSALGFAALILMWDSPYLLTQAGVQLSFGAIVGLGLSGRERVGVSDTFDAGIGMHAMTIPLVLWHFFQFPLYGIFLNLLVVPFAGILVGSAGTGLVLAEISQGAGQFAAGGARLLLRWYEWCCLFFAKFPGSHLILGRPGFWQIGVYYGALAGSLFLLKKWDGCENQNRAHSRAGWTMGVFFALGIFLLPLPHRGLDVTFLDVGQGDGICIRADSSVILVDGGSSDEKSFGKNRLVPFLKSSGIREIDAVIVSHGDTDHTSGLLWLFQEEADIRVKKLILPRAGAGDPVYGTLTALAERRGSDVVWLERGDELRAGRLRIRCLYPGALVQGERERIPGGTGAEQTEEKQTETEKTDRNEQSLVLRVEYGKFAMLLTGDMSQAGEDALIKLMCAKSGTGLSRSLPSVEGEPDEIRGIFLLKLAHHGSRFSNSEEWLDAVRPQMTVVSYGKKNRYGHPHEETIERLKVRGIRTLGTGQDGSIFVHTDGKKVSWKTWRQMRDADT